MKNLYFLCLAKQNFKLTVFSKGFILQFSFDPLFIKLLFKILKMKRNRQPSNLIIFISSYSHITLHPSYILISSVIVCTRASFFSDEAPQWWWCHTRSRAVPDTVYPQLDQNILLCLSLELHPKMSLISPCHISHIMNFMKITLYYLNYE